MKNNKKLTRKLSAIWTALVLSVCICAIPAYATGSDPLTVVNNLSDFIFSCIKAIGIIILGWGVVQVGMSIQGHDASQRSQGFLCLFGGLIIAFAKEILSAIGAV
jgi:hypothetical protein